MNSQELVGVCSYDSKSLKQQALLFDKIVIPHLKYIQEVALSVPQNPKVGPPFFVRSKDGLWCAPEYLFEEGPCFQSKEIDGGERSAEIDWLIEQGVVLESNATFSTEQSNSLLSEIEQNSEYIGAGRDLVNSSTDIYRASDFVFFIGGFDVAFKNKTIKDITCSDVQYISKRLISIKLRILEGLNAVPSLETPDIDIFSNTFKKPNANVLQVVLNQMPIPDDSVSWEQLIEFREDQDAKHARIGLRNWMNKVAREDYSVSEMVDELEYLLHRYESYIKHHKMKYKKLQQQVLIKMPFSLAEDLIKLRLEKLVDRLFEVRNGRMALADSEINAPGREVAYISICKEKFS